MQIVWMIKYRELVEKMIRLCNVAAACFTEPLYEEGEIKLTAHQVQILEYALEERDEKMSQLAARIGISKSIFSRNANSLISWGLIQKEHRNENRKEFYLTVTPRGAQVYENYSKLIYERWFKTMFEMADHVPRKYIDIFEDILEGFTNDISLAKSAEKSDQKPV